MDSEKKIDLRSQVTIKLICDGLMSLLNEGKKLSDISVTEVCEKAQINRATFYKHFKGIEEAYRAIEDNLLSFVLDTIKINAAKRDKLVPDELFDFLDKNGNVALVVLSGVGRDSLLDRIFEEVKRLYFSSLQLSDKEKERAETLYSFLFGGSKELVYRWLKNGKRESPEEISSCIETLAKNLIQNSGPDVARRENNFIDLS